MEYNVANDNYDAWITSYKGLHSKTKGRWLAIRREFDVQKPPMTVRQMFYRMASQGIVDKSERGYRKIQYDLCKMRLKGAIPFGWIADNTRWVRQATAFNDVQSALDEMQAYYRRRLWNEQPQYIEVWLEKDALAGVIFEVTEQWDVALYVTRGYPSLSYLYEAAESLKQIDKPITIYHFGDYDASGQDAARATCEGLYEFGAKFDFVQAAVLPEQIQSMNLQTRPSKKSDPRAKQHGAIAVELDAIAPADLRQMVENIITKHIDHKQLQMTQTIEASERDFLAQLIQAQSEQQAQATVEDE